MLKLVIGRDNDTHPAPSQEGKQLPSDNIINDNDMNILLLGSGGREHAIAWKISQSPKVDKLFIAPGNAGTAQVGTNAYIKADDFAAIKDFVLANDVNMVVVGPEDPLVKGVYDFFKNDASLAGIPVIGHSRKYRRRIRLPRIAACPLRAESRRTGCRKRRTHPRNAGRSEKRTG